jgi:hypothetical protein
MKTDDYIKLYTETYLKLKGKEPIITKKGGWVYINNNPTAHRAYKLKEFARNLEERANVFYCIKEKREEQMKEIIEQDKPEDIRALVSAIRMDGRHIFRSQDIKEMQRAGNRIAKMAKRILNIMDKEEM